MADDPTIGGDGLPGRARFPDRVRLPLQFDAAALAGEVADLAGVGWTPHVVRQNYAGEWSVLPLRAAAGETHPIRLAHPVPGATAWADTPLLARAPACRAVLAALRCPLRNVRLMRLTPGSAILEHADLDLAVEDGLARLHVPVTTNAQVRFLLNGTEVPMLPGELWYVRLADAHAVRNDGTTDRVHLVIDAEVNDWLVGLVASACRLV